MTVISAPTTSAFHVAMRSSVRGVRGQADLTNLAGR
jgi:hypothetical protein